MAKVYVALLHHPVYDKHGQVVTTSLTTIDLHDIARSCRTFGIEAFYVVSPVDGHRGLARRVLGHWHHGAGADYNPNRSEALELVCLERSLEGVEIDIEKITGKVPLKVVTSARGFSGATSFDDARVQIAASSDPHLILLGTGWGLAKEVIERADLRLEAIAGTRGYNHLSVRAAAAIILDRLLGTG